MTIDEQIVRVKELIAKREEIDRQMTEPFAGTTPAKSAARCKVCGQAGHNSKTCPTKGSDDSTASEPA